MTRKDGSGRAKGLNVDREHCPTVYTPLRTLRAVAPSGGEIVFLKWVDSDESLSFYRGSLTAVEDAQMWTAKLKAERGGIDKWNQAIKLLVDSGWKLL